MAGSCASSRGVPRLDERVLDECRAGLRRPRAMSNSDCGTTSIASGSSIARSSRSLPGLPVASTTRMSARHVPRAALRSCRASSWPMPFAARFEQLVELVRGERVAFGRALHFDEAAAVVHHDVHVGLGLASPRRSRDRAPARRRRCRPTRPRPDRASDSRAARLCARARRSRRRARRSRR